jgi:cobalt-zinc-cadmium efflux system membrane fusion protein
MFGMDCERLMGAERGIHIRLPSASRPVHRIACIVAATFVEIAAAVAQQLDPAGAGGGANAGVLIRLDERALRAGGIGVEPVMRERGGADFALPGNVVIPPGQVHVVAAPAAGLVDALLVSADEAVKTDQPVARLRSPTIVEAQQQFLSAIADESLAADRLRRTKLLIDGKAIPERELNIAQAESARAKARLDERTQLLSLMGLSDAQISELRTTRRIVPTITIYSPVNGTVVKRHTSPGERIDATAPLFTIAELDPLWVELQVPAARLPNLTVGSEVSLPAQRARGKIIRIGRTVDPSTQSAIAVAEIGTAGTTIWPGLAVNATVIVGTQIAGIDWSVPVQSVVRHRDRNWVFVRAPEGFRAVPVQVVSESPRGVWLRAPLLAGDRVATSGIISLLAQLAAADQE